MLPMKKEIGIVITSCRKQHQFKQDYMAFKLGITTHAYANIERGRRDMPGINCSIVNRSADIIKTYSSLRKAKSQGAGCNF